MNQKQSSRKDLIIKKRMRRADYCAACRSCVAGQSISLFRRGRARLGFGVERLQQRLLAEVRQTAGEGSVPAALLEKQNSDLHLPCVADVSNAFTSSRA